MKRRFIIFVLPLISMALATLQTQFPNRALGFSAAPVYASSTGFEDIQFVSVAFNPSILNYPDKNMSPYGPEVSPVYNLTKQALAYLNSGNPDNPLSSIVMPGDVVVLKPNLVSPSGFASEGCTRTPILRPLVDFAVQAGASKVIIAEGSSTPYPDSRVFGPDYSNITGLTQTLQSMYPEVVITYQDLNMDNFTWVDLGENSTFYGAYTPQQLYSINNMRMDEDSYYYAQDCNGYDPKGYRPGLYAIANTVFQADVFINVPKMKVHWITGVTLSLKNLVGITVSSTGNTTQEESIKDVPHWNNSGPKPIYDEVLARQDSFENDVVWRVMTDLNKIVLYADENGLLKPVKQRRYLSVVDAVIGMEGPTVYGPPGVPRPTGSIIAGQNPVAVDAVCCRVMGFNHTILNSLVNVEQVSDHLIGNADPTAICVLGTSLNSTTLGEPYVPHVDYEDPQIAPYKIRLQYFYPPEAELIKTDPETPWEGVETKILVYTQSIDLVAAGWLRYSFDGAEPMIMKMVPSGETLIGNLGLLEGGTTVSYEVCLQDFFFNTGWSEKMQVHITEHAYLAVRGLNNRVYYRVYYSSSVSWESWNVLPTGYTCDSPAAAVCCGRLHVVVRGFSATNIYGNYSLWYGWINLTDNGFSGWTKISGQTPSAPTLVSYDDKLVLVVRGLNNRVYYRFYDCVSAEWGDWITPPGRTCDRPAAAVLNDELHIVVRGFSATNVYGNYSLWHGFINLTTEVFSGWTKLPGQTPSAPTLTASQALNSLYLLVRGLNDRIYYNVWNGVNWEGWTILPGATSDGPAATIFGDELHIVVRGKNTTTLWHYYINLSTDTHSGWTKISGQTPSAPTLTS